MEWSMTAAKKLSDSASEYRVQLFGTDGFAINTDAGRLTVRYYRGSQRIAITNNADTYWADCGPSEIDEMVEAYLNDYDTFAARN